MRRKGSYIAGEIIRDLKLEEAYRKKKRANCKEKNCIDCNYNTICENNEVEVDGE